MLVKAPARTILCFWLALISGGPAIAACGLTKVTEMPLVKLGNHYAVMVRINNEVRPMIVDTGAEVTNINLSVVEDLDLKLDDNPLKASRVLGVGQTTAETYRNVVPSILGFGDLVYRDRSTAVAKQDFGDVPEQDAIGLLGDDILSHFDVEFDFPAGKLTFYHAAECYESFVPWTGGYSAVPFVHDRAKIVIDVVLNDERNQAIVDTGNPLSFVSRSLLARWRVNESAFSKTVGKISSPLNGGTSFAVKMFAFDVVKIGYEVFPPTIMSIVDVDFPLASINLGLDFWKSRKIWISYPNKWMFVSRTAATTVAYPVQTTN
jgi:hypothetical protein